MSLALKLVFHDDIFHLPSLVLQLLLSIVARTPPPIQSVVYFDSKKGSSFTPVQVLTPLDKLGVLINIQLPRGSSLNLSVCVQTNLSVTGPVVLQVELGEEEGVYASQLVIR